MTTKEAVLNFIDAANDLRSHEPMEIGFALLDFMREAPIRTSYALYSTAALYEQHIHDRLPEG